MDTQLSKLAEADVPETVEVIWSEEEKVEWGFRIDCMRLRNLGECFGIGRGPLRVGNLCTQALVRLTLGAVGQLNFCTSRCMVCADDFVI